MQNNYSIEELDSFKKDLVNIISDKKDELGFSDIVILCIGNPKIYYDRVGPRIGSCLSESTNLEVYGTMTEPLVDDSLFEKKDEILKFHDNKLVIVIDACIGKGTSQAGLISIVESSVKPAFGKTSKIDEMGHISVLINTAYIEDKNPKYYVNLPINRINSIIDNLSSAVLECIKG